MRITRRNHILPTCSAYSRCVNGLHFVQVRAGAQCNNHSGSFWRVLPPNNNPSVVPEVFRVRCGTKGHLSVKDLYNSIEKQSSNASAGAVPFLEGTGRTRVQPQPVGKRSFYLASRPILFHPEMTRASCHRRALVEISTTGHNKKRADFKTARVPVISDTSSAVMSNDSKNLPMVMPRRP